MSRVWSARKKCPGQWRRRRRKHLFFWFLCSIGGFSVACFDPRQTACRNNMKHAHTHACACSVVRFTRQCNLFIYYPSVEIFNMPIFGGGSVGGDGGGSLYTDNNSIFGFSFIWLRIIFSSSWILCAERASVCACELEKWRWGARKYTRRHCTTLRIHNFYDRIPCLSAAFWWDEHALILFHFIFGSFFFSPSLSFFLFRFPVFISGSTITHALICTCCRFIVRSEFHLILMWTQAAISAMEPPHSFQSGPIHFVRHTNKLNDGGAAEKNCEKIVSKL